MSDNHFDWSTPGDGIQGHEGVQGSVTPAELIARAEEQARLEQAGADES
jgi:hypothetical protein